LFDSNDVKELHGITEKALTNVRDDVTFQHSRLFIFAAKDYIKYRYKLHSLKKLKYRCEVKTGELNIVGCRLERSEESDSFQGVGV